VRDSGGGERFVGHLHRFLASYCLGKKAVRARSGSRLLKTDDK